MAQQQIRRTTPACRPCLLVCFPFNVPRVQPLTCSVASIQIAGFAGANVFKAKDAPRYKHGLVICGACAAAGAVVVLIWKALYALEDRKVKQATQYVGPNDQKHGSTERDGASEKEGL